MAYNSDGYIMFDFSDVDFRRTTQTIEGLYDRCVKIIGTNKFILVINANGKTPLPSVCSFINNQYVIESCLYTFAITSNDTILIRRNEPDPSQLINDEIISPLFTWSSTKIDSELDTKADASALADYQPLLTAGTNITIDENNVISSTGGAVIDDSVIVNNKVWSSLNTVEQLAPIDTIVNNPAVFNTSLALPLVECSTNIMATQEGSGDPSPDNVRPIHGFSEVNANVGSGNLFDGTFDGYKELSLKAGKQLILQGDMSNDVYLVLRVYDENKTRLQAATTILGTGTRYGVMTLNSDISYYSVERSSQSGTYNNIMLSFGNTVKPYTPYVTPTIYTIQLGQEVYGGVLDLVRGILTITRQIVDLGSLTYTARSNSVFTSSKLTDAPEVQFDILCNEYEVKQVNSTEIVSYDKVISSVPSYNRQIVMIRDTDHANDDATTFKTAMNGVQLVYELAIPIEVQLTPTQIETLIGNNTIFADTGNIKVSYRHLPIDLL